MKPSSGETMFRMFSIAGSLALLLSTSTAQASFVLSTFDANNEGWKIVDLVLGDPPTLYADHGGAPWSSVGGNLGGFVSSSDPVLGPWWWFSAPAAFLGDKSTYYGGTLSFDLQATGNDGNAGYPAAILVGDGTALYYTDPPPGPTWTSYSLSLTPAGWREGDYLSGPAPTVARMQAVLGDLTGLYIDGDWLSGVEVTGLDNPMLANESVAVPEPASFTILALSSVVLAGYASRRRKSGDTSRAM
jgi:hypothetical protein